MIRFTDLRKSFDGRPAVSGIDLEIRDGEVLGLLGPNGAGKTTLIRCLVGLLRPDTGRIEVDGIDAAAAPEETKRRIGYLPDRPFLYDRLSAWEFLRLSAALYRVEAWEAAAEAWLSRFGLMDERHQFLETFSHGTRQKIVLVSALMRAPSNVVLDEPMAGLDARAARLMRTVLRDEAKRGAAVLLSTHTLEVAERICDRLAIIDRGAVVACGRLEEIRRTVGERLEDVVLRLTGGAEETPP